MIFHELISVNIMAPERAGRRRLLAYRCFDELDDAVIILDQNNAVARLNRQFQETFGIDNETVLGMDAREFAARYFARLFFKREDADQMLEALQSKKETLHTTCRMRTHVGEVRWFSFSRHSMAGKPYEGMTFARFQDITSKRYEAIRSASITGTQIGTEAIFADIGELIPFGVWICEPDGTTLYVSPSFLDLTGASLEECRTRGWLKCAPISNQDTIFADWRRCVDAGCQWNRELKITRLNGECHTILSRGGPIHANGGEIILWAGINLDITARKRAEQLTAVRAAQQAAIADLGRFALAGADLPELMDALVRAVARHLGVECVKVLRYIPDEENFLLEAAVGFSRTHVGTEIVDGGTDSQAGYTLLSCEPVIVEDFDTETRFCGPDLLRREGIVSGISVIIHGEDSPYGVFGAHTRSLRRFTRDDINFVRAAANILAQGIKRKETEEALINSEEKFRAIAQRSFDMIYTCYYKSGIAYMSPAVTRILGYSPEELIGQKCQDYVSPLAQEEWRDAQKRLARGEPVEGLEVEFRRKDGTTAFVELNESPIMEHGKVVGVQTAGRDITERKQHERLQRQAFRQIEQNIEQFAVLGDHIRQPLQVALGRAELLDDEEATEVIRSQVERINNYIKQLDQGWVESRKVREFLQRREMD